MIKDNQRRLNQFHVVLDGVVIVISYLIAYYLVFYGGFGSGTEFFTWQGQPCGYEGPLVGNFPVLAAMAMHYGYLSPIEGEWCIDE